MPNEALLRKTLAFIKSLPKTTGTHTPGVNTWNQDSWGRTRLLEREGEHVCGTAACFAGWTVLNDEIAQHINSPGIKIQDIELNNENCTVKGEVTVEDIQTHAADLLGIAFWESEKLFDAKNSIEDLEYIIERIIDGTLEDYEDD
jgi:hypothetical protein